VRDAGTCSSVAGSRGSGLKQLGRGSMSSRVQHIEAIRRGLTPAE